MDMQDPAFSILFFSGMHRSGTSFLAKRFHDAGTPFPGDLLPPNADNPEGYWEARECVSLNNEMLRFLDMDWKSLRQIRPAELEALGEAFSARIRDCLTGLAEAAGGQTFAVKDPRFCRLLPLWLDACRDLNADARLIATYRAAPEVAISLFRRTRVERFRPAAVETPDQGLLLWLRYMLDLEHHSRTVRRVFIPFRDIRHVEPASVVFEAPSPDEGPAEPDETPASFAEACKLVLSSMDSAQTPKVRARFDHWRKHFDDAINAVSNSGSAAPSPIRKARLFGNGLGLSRVGTSTPVIAFVSGEPTGRGHIYRIENRIAALMGGEASCLRVDPEIHDAEDIAAAADAIIIFRRGMDAWQDRLVNAARARSVSTVFDIDDLLFEPDLIDPQILRFLRDRPLADVAAWKEKAASYRAALDASDFAWASTQPLVRRMEKYVPRANLLKNGLTDHQLRLPAPDPRERADRRGIRLGYFSGTATHDEDLRSVIPAIEAMMSDSEDVSFHIRGPISDGVLAPLGRFSERVVRHPFVNYYELSQTFDEVDVNLAPLEQGNPFCDCKSELKFFEAGIRSIPTVMSSTEPLHSCAPDGQAGLVASTVSEWIEGLERLVSNADRRLDMGNRAREESVARFGPSQQRKDFFLALDALLPGFSNAGMKTDA